MKQCGGCIGDFASRACSTTQRQAQDKPLIVYVSPNPLGVNDFLKLGKAGTDRVAAELGARGEDL